ncbi:MAG: CHASE2 domain-containing protein [Oscillospiraceae bacterium]|nr:CHASE2 domain-containing protein [Oscillospiraceae bacterium]
MKLSSKLKKLITDVILAGLLTAMVLTGMLSYFNYRFQDMMFQRPDLLHPDIFIIGIDEVALDEFGNPLQWSRDLMAEAIEILNSGEYGQPAVIALDVLYTGASIFPEADAHLAKAARDGGNVVVAANAVVGDRRIVSDELRTVRSITGVERPYRELAESAVYGIANGIIDSDGRIRSTRLFYEHDGAVIYSFPYEIYRMYMGIEEDEPWVDYSEKYITYNGEPGSYFFFSFAEIFDEYFEPDYFEDGIVMIGAYAQGLLDDFYVPLYSERMHGVEVHANILQMLLDENFKEYAPFSINLIIFLFILAAAFVLAYFLEIRWLLAAYAGMIAAYLGAAWFTFQSGYMLSLLYPVFSVVVIYIFQLIYGYVKEMIERKKAQLIAEKHQILVESINYASVIQKGLLPKDSAFEEAFADYSVIWNPRDTVGGDIYWLKKLEKGSVLCVCDCTGHGVPGALLTALVVSSLEEIVNEENCGDPASIIFQLDKKLNQIFEAEIQEKTSKRELHIKNGCDLAVLFTDNAGNVSIASGNFNIFICDGKEVTRVKGQRIYVGEGKIKDSEAVKVTSIPANPDNKFYISSDGMYDQVGGTHGHSFGYNIFKKLILENHGESQKSISEKVWTTFEEYRGNQARLDDFELVSFRTCIIDK